VRSTNHARKFFTKGLDVLFSGLDNGHKLATQPRRGEHRRQTPEEPAGIVGTRFAIAIGMPKIIVDIGLWLGRMGHLSNKARKGKGQIFLGAAHARGAPARKKSNQRSLVS
jgi:hypothetical protein